MASQEEVLTLADHGCDPRQHEEVVADPLSYRRDVIGSGHARERTRLTSPDVIEVAFSVCARIAG